MSEFTREEIDAVREFLDSGMEIPERPRRAEKVRALHLVNGDDFLNDRGNAIKHHLFGTRPATRWEEETVIRFDALRADSPNRREVEAELLRLDVGYRQADGEVALNFWGWSVYNKWRIANR